MSIKVFTEYKVKSEEEAKYRSLLHSLLEYHREKWGINDFHIFEGTDQPNLFVEEFHVENLEEYKKYKDERILEKKTIWKNIHNCIAGGRDKVHIWSFKRLDTK